MLTAVGCHWCEEAETLLARLAGEFELNVVTRSADDDAGRALAMASGALFPPVIFVNGEFAQYGRPSERKLRAILSAAASATRQESV